MLSQQEILNIAAKVLQWANRASRYTSSKMYFHPNVRGSLQGMCGMASIVLGRMLEYHGEKVTYCIHNTHTYLVVQDHILDITARQFKEVFHDADESFILFTPVSAISALIYNQRHESEWEVDFEIWRRYQKSNKNKHDFDTYFRLNWVLHWHESSLIHKVHRASDAVLALWTTYPSDQHWRSMSSARRSYARCKAFIQKLTTGELTHAAV